MNADKLPQTSPPQTRGGVCVVIAASADDGRTGECLQSVRAHTDPGTPVLSVAGTAAAVNEAIAGAGTADVVVIGEPCLVGADWIGRLRAGAHSDTNIATVSALADVGGPLALCEDGPAEGFEQLAEQLAERTLTLRPRLERAVGPCVFVRREAVELVGPLDETLPLRWALEVDLAQRCLLAGLAHVAADDVLVARLEPGPDPAGRPPPALLERYPHLRADAPVAASSVLVQALAAARPPGSRLSVTIDARALDRAVTGTQVHILELVLALARTGALALRVLVREQRIDPDTLTLLRGLPETELLDERDVREATARSAVVHRPQQSFAAEDVAIALALGERMVISQLDLIAYSNPGYFPDADAWKAYRRASRHGLSASERVVVFSEHTRRELLVDGLVEDGRIRIVAPGLDHRIGGEPRRPQALEGIGARPFLLCLGTDFRHKNRVFAMRLLDALRQRHGWEGSLVLAGTHIRNGSSRELEQELLAQRPQLREAVLDLGAVGEQEKAWLIANARAVVYPSVYEGFGLVPFESALLGTPCLFAAQASLADAAPAGTATIVPWDPDASADAAMALLGDAPARAQHVQTLATAARLLSWERAAEAMVEVYREAAVAPVRDAAVLSRDAVERERELTAAHMRVVQRLTGEREHAQRMYDELNAEVGSGLGLIGPHGALPEDAQNALLALSARPALSRPLFRAVAGLFRAARGLARTLGRGSRRTS